jgi:hypothetical protein
MEKSSLFLTKRGGESRNVPTGRSRELPRYEASLRTSRAVHLLIHKYVRFKEKVSYPTITPHTTGSAVLTFCDGVHFETKATR